MSKIKRALISVWDKNGIVEFSKSLIKREFEILSTGGTKALLEKNGVPVISVSDLTEFGAIMDGRVKTLHPKIFGGILADRNNESHINDLELIIDVPTSLTPETTCKNGNPAASNNLPHNL